MKPQKQCRFGRLRGLQQNTPRSLVGGRRVAFVTWEASMGQLGDVLELFYGRVESFQSVRATVRQWQDLRLAEDASGEAREIWGRKWARRKVRAEQSSATSQPISEKTLSVWMCKPSRARIEERLGADPSMQPSLIVTDGDHWAERDAEGHV